MENIKPKVNIAVSLEQIIFPLISLLFAWQNFKLLLDFVRYNLLSGSFSSYPVNTQIIVCEEILYFYVLTVFCLINVYVMLIRNNLKAGPANAQEVLIPLIATFWFFIYNFTALFPSAGNILILPEAYRAYAGIAGSLLSLIGITIALTAILKLKKSFGVLVQVRDVVTGGLYQYVRHPMYFGHILVTCGFILLNLRLYSVILALMMIAITLYRATLEEKKLSTHSLEYKEYMKTVPFILPLKLFVKK